MRYWIWWNDLIQGPFELEELTSLRAFSEDLPVCMEDRQEWLPASRVADLSSAVEQLKAKRAAPFVPPPPPPRTGPKVTPLQGELFGDAPGQQSLLETDEGSQGPYAYRPVVLEAESPMVYLNGIPTMPFHFYHAPQAAGSVVEMLRPAPKPTPLPAPVPIPTPMPVRRIMIEPVIKESAVPAPAPLPPPPVPEKKSKPVDLQILREDVDVAKPSEAPVFAERATPTRPLNWIPWLAGVAFTLGILAAAVFWWIDRASTRSAINEVRPVQPIVAEQVPKPPPIPTVKQTPVAKSPTPKAVKKPKPKPKAVVAKPAPKPEPIPKPAPEPVVAPEPVAVTVPGIDAWANRQDDAIRFVTAKNIPGTKTSIGSQAKTMLQEMHQKELVHAAETGERLYLPDKISWSALREEEARYRVYLNFMAWRPSGERVQTRSYQFIVDLEQKAIKTDDTATQQDILSASANPPFKHNPMAVDIESLLGGVDFYNKQKMRAMIVKDNRRNRAESKNISAGMDAAKEKITRAAVYFRRTYSDKALQNLAKAYNFSELIQ